MSGGRSDIMPADDYKQTFEDFWRPLVCNADGVANVSAANLRRPDHRGIPSIVAAC